MRIRPALSFVIAMCLSMAVAVEAAAPKKKARKRRPAAKPIPVSILTPPNASSYDLRVSEAARVAIRGRSNVAIVAMDPWTGRVLTIGNPRAGLLTAYQPCSVFKLVVAVAGLQEGIITPDTRYNCTTGCWLAQGHGPIDLRRSLAVSCNTYYEWIGERLGFEKVTTYARLLGLGAPTGVNVPGEAAGVVPARVPSLGVGHMSSHAQGVKTSAMQLASLMSALVNGGVMHEPQLAAAETLLSKEKSRVAMPALLTLLTPGLFSAVTEGSAQRAFDPGFVATGKTGSCSGVGWFASSLGYPRAELVVVSFIRGGNGSAASAVAGEFYRALLGVSPQTHSATVASGGQ